MTDEERIAMFRQQTIEPWTECHFPQSWCEAVLDRLDYLESINTQWRTLAMEHGLSIGEAVEGLGDA